MENNTGLKGLLQSSRCYDLLQRLVYTRRGHRFVREQVWNIKPGSKVIDIGCGPGKVLDFLPHAITYAGIDISSNYIAAALQKYGDRGLFLNGTTSDYMTDERLGEADVIMCNYVLHHLNDREVAELFAFVHRYVKKPGGRFSAIEPCHLIHESRLATWFMNQDRGLYIRQEHEWKTLLGGVVKGRLSTSVIDGMIRIPYKHIWIQVEY